MSGKNLVNQNEQKAALVIDPKDNVAIALTDLSKGDTCKVRFDDREEEVVVLEDVSFGHKFAIESIKNDNSVYKYGEEIGKMKESIGKGGWIHIHNMYCERGLKHG